MADLSSILGAVQAFGAAPDQIQVEIRSALSPPLVLRPLAAGGGGGGFFLGLLRPQVIVTAGGQVIASTTPAGAPPAVPWLGIGLLLGAAAISGLLVAAGRWGR